MTRNQCTHSDEFSDISREMSGFLSTLSTIKGVSYTSAYLSTNTHTYVKYEVCEAVTMLIVCVCLCVCEIPKGRKNEETFNRSRLPNSASEYQCRSP